MKQVKRLIGFLQIFCSFIPNLSEHLILFYKLLRENVSFGITDEIKVAFEKLRDKLETSTTQTHRLAKPGLEYAILCDASYHSSGFVIFIEDYVQNKEETVKFYAAVSFGCEVFNTTQLRTSIYCKAFLSLYFASDAFSHLIWGGEKPILILPDNKSLTRFLQAKTIPPSLWIYVDRFTAFSIVLSHVPGKANVAADFLSRLRSILNETYDLKLTDRIPIREIEVDVRAKLPDNTNSEFFADNLPVDSLQVVDINTLITLKQSGFYDQAVSQLKFHTEHGTISDEMQQENKKLTPLHTPTQ